VLTIPQVLRGVLQRERRLLGLVARSGRDAIVASFRAILDRRDVQPGLVVSIQTRLCPGRPRRAPAARLRRAGRRKTLCRAPRLRSHAPRLRSHPPGVGLAPRTSRPAGPHGQAGPAFFAGSWKSILLCARCGSEMKVVSVIDDQAVIDAILRHVQRTGWQDPFEGPFQGRAPPEA